MSNMNSAAVQHCPDCGQQLETLWDYPSNEVWCLHCGNRFYRTLSMIDGGVPLSGSRLLILDADSCRRDSLTGRFANLGFHVTPVCHPRQAMEAASFRHFDLTLLSANWPGFDISALIAKLRWQLGDVKFVVYVDDEAGISSSELATHDVLCVKMNPSQTHDLETTLEQLIEELVSEQRLSVSANRWDFALIS